MYEATVDIGTMVKLGHKDEEIFVGIKAPVDSIHQVT